MAKRRQADEFIQTAGPSDPGAGNMNYGWPGKAIIPTVPRTGGKKKKAVKKGKRR